ncbi:hypothetical protein Nepgr_015188 [Nepenthes gracilis]|uniref:Pentatricopeptide repeat-containing protein n=1 Tax=Nepenthes gracilis TaxID=150966 RepID=A0AAD3XQ73_NEPGR|nr:hypothetical protein Nepgr_015188 [Nepenthes gracilis]
MTIQTPRGPLQSLFAADSRIPMTDLSDYLCLLRVCKGLRSLLQIHGRLVVLGIAQSDFILAHLINIYSSFQQCESARFVFNSVPNHSVVLYNSMIRAYTRSSQNDNALKLYHEMLDGDTKPDKYTYTFLLKAFTGKLEFAEGVNIHRQVAKAGLESDMFIATGLIDMYCKMGQLECARELFDKMPKRDVVAWNAMISGFSQSKNSIVALNLFRRMQLSGVSPNSVSLLNLFPAVCKLVDLQLCRCIHGFVIRRDFQSQVINGMIDMYSKCGCVGDARSVFDRMCNRDNVSWGTMMAGYAHNGYFESVLELFEEIKKENRLINKVSVVSSALAASELRDLEKGKEIHSCARQQHIDSDILVATAVMMMYAKCGELNKAKRLFEGFNERDLVAWSALISAFVQSGFPKDALCLFREMLNEKIKPNGVTLMSILPACAEHSYLKLGRSIHCYSLKAGFDSETSTGSALVSMYAKCGLFDPARVIFHRMPCKDVVTWNALINGYAQVCYPSHALEMFDRLRSSGMKPDSGTMVGVVPACALSHDLDKGTYFHALIIKSGFQSDAHVKNALIDMYAKCGRLLLAELLFNEADYVKDEVTWNAIIAAYMHNNCSKKAISAFREMREGGLQPNMVSIVSVLPAVADLTALQDGIALHAYTIRLGYLANTLVGNSLIDMYAKCGRFDYAKKHFDEMENRDTISWNAMLAGYAVHGHGNHAISLFLQMQESNVMVDAVSFLCVLSACRHAGLVEEGRNVFRFMCDKHHFEPQLEHYACMVDLLGRSGLFDETMDLINEMPVEPDAGLWGALLGACRMHSNVKLAEVALNHLVKLEPRNPAHHVGLSNIYAQSGRWLDAGDTRLKLTDNGLKKITGCSWVEVKTGSTYLQ